MTLQSEKGKYYLVEVKPKLKEDQEAFRMAKILLDKEYLLPVRIALISPDNKSTRTFRSCRASRTPWSITDGSRVARSRIGS